MLFKHSSKARNFVALCFCFGRPYYKWHLLGGDASRPVGSVDNGGSLELQSVFDILMMLNEIIENGSKEDNSSIPQYFLTIFA